MIQTNLKYPLFLFFQKWVDALIDSVQNYLQLILNNLIYNVIKHFLFLIELNIFH
jgi:hypothetical protein